MMTPTTPTIETPKAERLIRFGVFEVDLAAGELRRRGLRVKLQNRPFQILALLLGRPGQVVTREELRKALWPSDTFVDFDNGINTAINRLREALSDSAENPRFIETLGGRGYRWIPVAARPSEPEPLVTGETDAVGLPSPAPSAEGVPALPPEGFRQSRPEVRQSQTAATEGNEEGRQSQTAATEGKAENSTGKSSVGRTAALLAAGVTFLLGALASFWWFSPAPLPKVIRTVELTHSGRVDDWGRIVLDGGRLLFLEREGNHWNLVETSAAGGEVQPVPAPFPNTRVLDISPDRSEFLLTSFVLRGTETPLWAMPVAGGPPRRLGDILARDAVWCPDGRQILFVKGSDLYLADRDGSQARKFLGTNGEPGWLAWSPDGRVLRFTMGDPERSSSSLWEVAADGTGLHALLPGWSNPPGECCGRWTPDGRYFLFSSSRGGINKLWALPETRSFLRQAPRPPVELTSGPAQIWGGVPSQDGKRLFAFGVQPQTALVRYEAQGRRFVPLAPWAGIWSATFSRDGEWIAYVTTPGSVLCRSKSDGSEQLQLTFTPQRFLDVRWSPDGRQIAFAAAAPGEPPKAYIVSSGGGTPREVGAEWRDKRRLDWSPDGGSLVFAVKSDSPAPRVPADALYVIDLKANKVSKVAGSEGMRDPAWSPDGRFLAAVSTDFDKLLLYDFQARQWAAVARGTLLTGLSWSRDGKSLYYQDLLDAHQPVYRLNASGRNREQVPGCEKVLESGFVRCALVGLDSMDSPLLQLTRGWADIYALDLDLP